MNPARMIYEDAPAFIPVPADLQHHRLEAIFWPLDDNLQKVTIQAVSRQSQSSGEPVTPLTQLIGKARGCFDNAAEVDAFLRAERDAWES